MVLNVVDIVFRDIRDEFNSRNDAEKKDASIWGRYTKRTLYTKKQRALNKDLGICYLNNGGYRDGIFGRKKK